MRFLLITLITLWAFTSNAIARINYMHQNKDPELFCLAQNIFHEAGTESFMGKVAVALVTLNRVKDNRYPNTVCDVVKQGPIRESWKTKMTPDPSDAEFYPVRNMCQFSWYCDGKDDRIVDADYVAPDWRHRLTLIGKIDRHIFYRWD